MGDRLFFWVTHGLECPGNPLPNPEVSRSWTILATISGFLEFEWLIDDGGFTAGSTTGGSWSLGLTNGGNDMLLSYAPVPEPSAILLAAMALGAMLALRRTRR